MRGPCGPLRAAPRRGGVRLSLWCLRDSRAHPSRPSSRAAFRPGVPRGRHRIRRKRCAGVGRGRARRALGGRPASAQRASCAAVPPSHAAVRTTLGVPHELPSLGLPRGRLSGLECHGGGAAFGGSGVPGWGAAGPVGPSGVALPLHSGLRALRCLRPMRPSVPPWEFLTSGLLAWSATEEAPHSEEAARRGGASAGL